MYYILIKCYFVLENLLLLYVPLVNYITLIYLFSSFNQIISLWIEIKNYFFLEYIQLKLLSPQIVTFGLVKGNDKSFLIQNMILVVFKL